MAILVALPIGAALLALWLLARRPSLLPDGLGLALAHFVLALVLVELAPRAVSPLAAEGRLTLLLAFLIVLWALVYAWLAVAAVLRTVLNALAE
jgi:hypothetical protein